MPVTIICQRCGSLFAVKPSWAAKTRYCSKACMYADRRTLPDSTCKQCGVIFRPYGRDNGHIFCSQACVTEYRRSLSPEDRAALLAKATDVIRGSKRSHDDLCKRARTKQERAKLSGDEAEIMAALNAAGLFPVPLYAVDKYNIDFAFPDIKLCVEYNGGNWHNTPKKRREDEIKTAFLESLGWTVVFFPRLDKPQANDAGNERIPLADLVAEVERLIHRRHLHSAA